MYDNHWLHIKKKDQGYKQIQIKKSLCFEGRNEVF